MLSILSGRNIVDKKLALRKYAVIVFSAMAFSALPLCAQANLIINGEFNLFTSGGPNQVVFTVNANPPGTATLQNWTNSRPFTAVYGPNAAETIGASGYANPLKIRGPLNGAPSYNTFNNMSPNQIADPTANFLAVDADPNFGGMGISQSITGLVQNQQYVLSYYWAAAQFTDSTGSTDTGWTVTLGNQLLVSGYPGGLYASIPSEGFSGWLPESIQFTYTGPSNTSEILNFLAAGNPTGRPPVALLDSVSLSSVQEPAPLSLVMIGLLALGICIVRRRHATFFNDRIAAHPRVGRHMVAG
jgi:hypothetical protein